jgi:hypothetical protein
MPSPAVTVNVEPVAAAITEICGLGGNVKVSTDPG